MDMTSNQPYLLSAFYEWIVDNDLTPYMVVNTTVSGVDVPVEYVVDGQIVLNVAPRACQYFHMDKSTVSLRARFGGVARELYFPVSAVTAIYARENGAGTVFLDESKTSQALSPAASAEKVNQVEDQHNIVSEQSDRELDTSDEKTNRPKRGKPTLKIIK